MAEKKVKGRKRHIVTDTQGHLLHIMVHPANIHDTVAGCEVFKGALEKYPSLQGVCADAGYRKTMEEFVVNVLKKTIEISARISKEWVVLTKRWIVERTFSWLNNFRRLSKDYEITTSSAENYAIIAHSMTLLKRFMKTGSKIGRTTLWEWQQRKKETGDFQSKKLGNGGYNHKITDWNKFTEFAKKHGGIGNG